MENNPKDYFYPNGGWDGYAKFFNPNISSKIGTVLLGNIYNALILNDAKSCLAAIAILSCEHTKIISQKGHKDDGKTIVCSPTEEAKTAIGMLKLQLKKQQREKSNCFIRHLFSLIWWHWMKDYKIIKVTGWRSCLYDNKYGQRVRATICLFPWD